MIDAMCIEAVFTAESTATNSKATRGNIDVTLSAKV